MVRNKFAAMALAFPLALAATAVQASLVLVGPEDFKGTGLGAVNTILTLQAQGNGTTEAGSVFVNGSNAEAISGDAKTGNSQTQLRTLSQLGVGSASTLRVVFNANENKSEANHNGDDSESSNHNGSESESSIRLDNLVLTIWNSSGTQLFTSGAFTSILFDETETGTGKSGAVFKLDAAQAASAQATAFGGAFGSNRVGLSASLSKVSDGVETFYVADTGTPASAPIPEPGSMALFAAGLVALAGIRRRKHA